MSFSLAAATSLSIAFGVESALEEEKSVARLSSIDWKSRSARLSFRCTVDDGFEMRECGGRGSFACRKKMLYSSATEGGTKLFALLVYALRSLRRGQLASRMQKDCVHFFSLLPGPKKTRCVFWWE